MPDTERTDSAQHPPPPVIQPGPHGGGGDSAGNTRVPAPREDDEELEPTIVLGRE
ncbi:hypothetical protein [Qaidamihabitans albus]|uniref:hypothetical protein n=1 Tax=Qaidamihabitans albus TaxID=2795733 RepID=UPI0018F14C97|nr:hypothetical protein [Qaidamihabitans albus]